MKLCRFSLLDAGFGERCGVLQAVGFSSRSGFLRKKPVRINSTRDFVLSYWTSVLASGCCVLGGGDAGDDGAVLELEDVLLEETLGVVVDELPELTVELESEVAKTWWTGAGWTNRAFCWGCCGTIVREWSVGIKGVLSSVVGVGGATREGPGCSLE